MATINGRRVKLLEKDGQPTGIARGWRQESDWMKVVTDDGTTHMVHYTDKIEIISWEEASSKTEADSQLRDAAERFLDAMASPDSNPEEA